MDSSLDIKDAIITISSRGKSLKGVVTFSSAPDTIFTLDNIDRINAFLKRIYDSEALNLADLVGSGRVVINSTKLWDKFNLSENKYFEPVLQLNQGQTPNQNANPAPAQNTGAASNQNTNTAPTQNTGAASNQNANSAPTQNTGAASNQNTNTAPAQNTGAASNQNTNTAPTQNTNNHKLSKKIIKITSIAGLLTLIGYGITRCSLDKNKSNEFSRNTIKTETNENVTLPTPFNSFTPSPIPRATSTQVVNANDTRLTKLVRQLYAGINISENDLDYVVKETIEVTKKNIGGVRDLIDGKRMTGNKEEINLYDMFPYDSIEYIVLKSFCLERNDFVNNAYFQNANSTKYDVNIFLNNISDFIFNGSTINYRDKTVNYYDLAPIARYLTICLGQQSLLADPNYVGRINNRACSFEQMMDEYEVAFKTVTNRLQNSSNRKK